ncbi:DUF2142 domain-containing protein [Candidimonas humi]|uniref:DUF2142 domain-containing protein n=1 Tax=Candidimonas humi TaxID=683355 RepID=A0ABV8NYT2_9BURK|nr:DUF2142 domain-containing protein [Candidimonas humi]MBV6304448.1 DUF2142 domain-containing protein [Candidimonas humi]
MQIEELLGKLGGGYHYFLRRFELIEKRYIPALLLGFILFSTLGRLIPPMQSPDENAHIMRAYLLSRGYITLKSVPGKMSGGEVDQGLYHYQQLATGEFAFHPNRKITQKDIETLSSVKWAGKNVFVEIPTTGYYFPLIYTPQALGLTVGKWMDLTVQQSYLLARLFALLSIVALLLIAFRTSSVGPFTIGLVILPMSLFQFFTASIDGIALALALACFSTFNASCRKAVDFPDRASYLLTVGLFILINSKIQLLPFSFIPFAIAIIRRKLLYFWEGLILVVASLSWLYIGIRFTNDGGIRHAGISQFFVLEYYIFHPLRFLDILINTLNIDGRLLYYRNSFIGVLGWIDTYFTPKFYKHVSLLLILLAVTSTSLANLRDNWFPRALLLTMSAASIFVIFLALLVQWNTFPAQSIDGIQGRYFIIPFCALSYALSWSTSMKPRPTPISSCLLAALIVLVATEMPKVLLTRYYIW